jgi:hypothetical protein
MKSFQSTEVFQSTLAFSLPAVQQLYSIVIVNNEESIKKALNFCLSHQSSAFTRFMTPGSQHLSDVSPTHPHGN